MNREEFTKEQSLNLRKELRKRQEMYATVPELHIVERRVDWALVISFGNTVLIAIFALLVAKYGIL